MQSHREPIFNLPGGIVVMLGLLAAIHIIRGFLTPEADIWVVYAFGFVPARYLSVPDFVGALPGGAGAEAWSFITYAFLHGDWLHLGINAAWMVAFATPVLRRFAIYRFLALSAVAAIAGAALHLVTHWGEIVPMIGASAAISGQMGAAVRFVFQRGPALARLPAGDERRWKLPALPLTAALRDIRIAAFVLIWFAVNYAFGTASVLPGEEAPVAWQAHIGGFLVGLLAFALFDPPPAELARGEPADQNSGSS